uniref:(northern house mosquito) hypothetical protein n=1 Tax=Culex pipiens TaxID=7175 RepID=A0A8D8HVE0_CULPI
MAWQQELREIEEAKKTNRSRYSIKRSRPNSTLQFRTWKKEINTGQDFQPARDGSMLALGGGLATSGRAQLCDGWYVLHKLTRRATTAKLRRGHNRAARRERKSQKHGEKKWLFHDRKRGAAQAMSTLAMARHPWLCGHRRHGQRPDRIPAELNKKHSQPKD